MSSALMLPAMESGAIAIADLDGGLDLQSTLESGQTYLWGRSDGSAYEATGRVRGSAWYHTVVDGAVLRARQRDGRLEWESTTDAVPILRRRLRLEDDLETIMASAPDDPLIEEAYSWYRGMRIVRDPFFACLVSFICSPQMRVERIYRMVRSLAHEFGRSVRIDGETYAAFPEPHRLAAASESSLRSLGLGYRAPYVLRTAEMVATGELTRDDVPAGYEAARSTLTEFVGVGEKVADCVCLFSLGHLDAVPLDTWIRAAIDEHYPSDDRGTYDGTSQAIRRRFGPYAGYAQTYLFHFLRHRD